MAGAKGGMGGEGGGGGLLGGGGGELGVPEPASPDPPPSLAEAYVHMGITGACTPVGACGVKEAVAMTLGASVAASKAPL